MLHSQVSNSTLKFLIAYDKIFYNLFVCCASGSKMSFICFFFVFIAINQKWNFKFNQEKSVSM